VSALGMNDRPLTAEASLDPSRMPTARIGVLRVQRDLKRESAIGFLATTRELGPDFNRVFSLDSRLKLGPNGVFTGSSYVPKLWRRTARGSGSGTWRTCSGAARASRTEAATRTSTPISAPRWGSCPGWESGRRTTMPVTSGGQGVASCSASSLRSLASNWDRQGQVQIGMSGPTSASSSPDRRSSGSRAPSPSRSSRQKASKNGIGGSFYTEGLKWLGSRPRTPRGRTSTTIRRRVLAVPRQLCRRLGRAVAGPSSRMRLENTLHLQSARRSAALLPAQDAAAQDTVYVNHLARSRWTIGSRARCPCVRGSITKP
jgi:hypothetical protein